MLDRVRSKLSAAAAWADGVALRASTAARTWALWPLLLAVAVGSGGWALRNESRLSTLDTNKLTEPERLRILISVGIALAALFLVYAAVLVARRIASGSWRALETLVSLNRWLFVLFTVPIVAALRVKDVEQQSPKLTLFLIALAAGLSTVTFYSWPDRREDDDAFESRARRLRRALGRLLPPLLVFALFALYGFFFSRLSIINHHALVTRTTDLGYYDNIFYQSIHRHPLGCSFIKAGYHGSAHFDPILVLLSPLYLIYPHAEFLLVLQSVWLGAGVFPVDLVGAHATKSRVTGLCLALVYALYPALHGANMYEFHSLTLVTPLVVWALYFLETGSTKRYWFTLLLLLLCREDVALLMSGIGFYAILTRRAFAVRTGWLTIVASGIYFVVVKAFFMTSSGVFMSGKDAYSFAYYYEALIPNHTGIHGLVVSLLTNPIFAIKTALDEPKLIFLAQLFVPLALLPFFVKRGRWMLVYGLAFCLLASRPAVYSIAFQYTAVLMPVAFALTPMALATVRESELATRLGYSSRRLARGLLGAVVVAGLLTSWKFGGVVDNAAFRGGFSRVARQLSDDQRKLYAWVRQSAEAIPKTAIVGTTNRIGPHVSNRLEAYFYPEHEKVDWMFLDEAELKPADVDKLKAEVANKQLVEVSRRDKLVVYKRSSAP